jgi:hypothetical protein
MVEGEKVWERACFGVASVISLVSKICEGEEGKVGEYQ